MQCHNSFSHNCVVFMKPRLTLKLDPYSAVLKNNQNSNVEPVKCPSRAGSPVLMARRRARGSCKFRQRVKPLPAVLYSFSSQIYELHGHQHEFDRVKHKCSTVYSKNINVLKLEDLIGIKCNTECLFFFPLCDLRDYK